MHIELKWITSWSRVNLPETWTEWLISQETSSTTDTLTVSMYKTLILTSTKTNKWMYWKHWRIRIKQCYWLSKANLKSSSKISTKWVGTRMQTKRCWGRLTLDHSRLNSISSTARLIRWTSTGSGISTRSRSL